MEDIEAPTLLSLPAELIQQVLSFLPATSLPTVASVCRCLHSHANSDILWQSHINENLPSPIQSASPLPSFRDLYIAHHPFWFLVRHKIWFSDSGASGKLILARYDHRRGCIEAYSIVAEPGLRTWEHWTYDERIAIHSFNPRVQLDLNQPVLKLDPGVRRDVAQEDAVPVPDEEETESQSQSQIQPQSTPPLAREILMDCSPSAGLYTAFMLARDLPPAAIGPGTQVWPPQRIPAVSRTRTASVRGFNGSGHRPSTLSEVSTSTFRLRRWMEFAGRHSHIMALNNERIQTAISLRTLFHTFVNGPGGTVRMGEEVSTFATLPVSAYTPTPQKPWRGIWCGDYSGHGCEFLALLQPDADEELPLPEGMQRLGEWLNTGRFRRDSSSSSSSYASAREDASDVVSEAESVRSAWTGPDDADTIPQGRIEGVKLTGDPNIPRGEYSFICPDIGDAGLVRIADEEAFRGARVVRSAGHIAGEGFVHDEYIPSQLILVSHDCVAQYWMEFRHISYYRRVNIDELLKL